MLVDMIHDNHGEPPFKTRFRDPTLLRSYGYDAIVLPEVIPGITAAGSAAGDALSPRPVADLAASIDARAAAALAAGLKVFFYADALLLPRTTVESRAADFFCDDRSGRLCPAKPAVLAAHEALVRALFARWPEASGLVMRTGEVYPESTPHMVGNPLHAAACPTCRAMSLPARMRAFIGGMERVVVEQLGKTYVHRAWQPTPTGVPNMHDDPDVYRAVVDALPRSERLCFSFKFTRGDFRAGAPANPCIDADDRPKWIEFPCEREFEAKGSFPNFQAPAWVNFLRQTQAAGGHTFFGWSRGGGWGGPYAQREEWIDANVYALAQIHRGLPADPRTIAIDWAHLALGVARESPAAGAVADVLMWSPDAVERLFYVRQLPPEASPPLLKDDLLDVTAMWAAATRLVESTAAAAACEDKLEGLSLVEKMRRAMETIAPAMPNKSQARDMVNTLVSYNSLAATLAHGFCGFVHFAQWVRGNRADATLASRAAEELEQAQAHWQHHTQRHALLPGSPSVFQENTFWERTNDCLEQLQVL